ncbi:MAG: DUF4263 domain-containing protein [Chitinophagaceae bacterium]|nr:MAG: DUF4263 domain-containing protein [Chitinophagaceae bacterium]
MDIILTENDVGLQKIESFLSALRMDDGRIYSSRNFRFCTIPIVLIVDNDLNVNAFRKEPASHFISNPGADALSLYIDDFRSVVKTWRRAVIDDLDSLGIAYNSGRVNYSKLLGKRGRAHSVTNVLSDSFRLLPRKLDYDWLTINTKQVEIAIDKYISELKRAMRSGKREEKRFHRVFNKYPFLLKRDNYSQHWYEARLQRGNGESYQPDFSLKPNFSQQTDLSIVEVKLPTEYFTKRKKFHPGPYSSLIDHIFQVNDYKDYLESDAYKKSISSVYGYLPSKVQYSLLIGRSESKEENLDILNTRMRQINAQFITLLTFDELLHYQVSFLERMKLLEVS